MNGARRARARRRASALADSPVLQLLGRAGIVVSGLLNVVLAIIAITLAVGGRRGEGDGGALEALSRLAGGVILLWLAAVALLALALWQAVQIAAGGRGARERWGIRSRRAIQALAYGVVGVVAVRFAIGGPDDESQAQLFTAYLLQLPGGAVVLALLGAGIAGVGIALIVIGVRRRFLDNDLDVPTERVRRWALVLGMTGYLGRGAAVAAIGALWIVSALSDTPALAGGVDVAFARLAQLPAGTVLLAAYALGFLGFAGYCGLRARWPRVDG